MNSISHICPDEHHGSRLDVFLTTLYPQYSRVAIQEWIRQAKVTLDGRITRPSERIYRGCQLQVTIPAPSPSSPVLEPEEIHLDILFEDTEMLVINKPPGMAVHPGAGLSGGTVANALAWYLRQNRKSPASDLRSGIVHRLDKDTSGLLVLAKNPAAQWRLSRSFAERTVHKHYLTLVWPPPKPSSGRIDLPICRHPVQRTRMTIARHGEGRHATTLYRSLAVASSVAILECKLLTGRTHQIRVHLQALGSPILGDKTYNPRTPTSYPRQMLHAWKLAIPHPITQKYLTFTSPPPQDFLALVEVDWDHILCTPSTKLST